MFTGRVPIKVLILVLFIVLLSMQFTTKHWIKPVGYWPMQIIISELWLREDNVVKLAVHQKYQNFLNAKWYLFKKCNSAIYYALDSIFFFFITLGLALILNWRTVPT